MLELFCMLDHLVGLLLRALIAQVTGANPLQVHVLVERRVAGTQDYHRESFCLPDDIRRRLIALVDRYPE
jgi:hypothetical protein